MSILSTNAMRKAAPDSEKTEKPPLNEEVSEQQFQKLLQIQRAAEQMQEKDFFSLIAEEKKEEKSEQEDKILTSLALAAPCLATSQISESFIQEVTATKAIALSAEVEALFEKMAACMIVMNTSHETETTIFLDNPLFADSTLFGTQITIREFSSAPKIFNIEILSHPTAIALIESNKMDLLSHFEKGNFNFTIHRLEARIENREGRPVFHRKEDDSAEEGSQ